MLQQDLVPAKPVTALPTYFTPPLLSRLPFSLHTMTKPPSTLGTNGSTVGYTDSHLPDIDEASLALHYALYAFHAVSDQYANLPYTEAFSWGDLVLPLDIEREW